MITRLHRKIDGILSELSPPVISTASFMLLLLLGWIDVVTGDYSLIVFYLIPVSITAWFVSKRCGILFCLLAIVVRIAADGGFATLQFAHSALHYWNELIEFLFLLIMSLLFSALKTNLDNEKELASRDPLTDTLNRRSFFDLAEYELNRSRRYELPFTVAYIDLDNFKDVNDRFGHKTGDDLLVAVVETIRSNIRTTDILSRFGGDEFVILLPKTEGAAAHAFLDKLHEHLNRATADKNWPVSFSIGAVTYLQPPVTVDEVIHAADDLMYRVKHSGKNRLLHQEIREGSNGERQL
jgi:diguanylate cyclase (GGDEF)-like protein